MKVIYVFVGVVILTLYNALGVWIHSKFLPFIPGSLIGMAFMFLTLLIGKDKLYKWGKPGADTLIMYLPLFFVPVTVGIIQYTELVSLTGLFIFVILIVSTMVVILITSWLIEKRLVSQEKQQ
ncbi:CidA/LrgA family protein [Alkalihalobacillus sp. 1P02AB]|uniref:CidA/LrgA family protein n=1 Tax=Alkalihalobacillus sp. 1P02AB TaxID=3132260 RepID=UPI0039A40FCC